MKMFSTLLYCLAFLSTSTAFNFDTGPMGWFGKSNSIYPPEDKSLQQQAEDVRSLGSSGESTKRLNQIVQQTLSSSSDQLYNVTGVLKFQPLRMQPHNSCNETLVRYYINMCDNVLYRSGRSNAYQMDRVNLGKRICFWFWKYSKLFFYSRVDQSCSSQSTAGA